MPEARGNDSKLVMVEPVARTFGPLILWRPRSLSDCRFTLPSPLQGGNSHESRVVAQLLTLMDGVTNRGRLVVLAATNRPNSIDTALRRPGRFDREIFVGYPDQRQRGAILSLLLGKMPVSQAVDAKQLANSTNG